MQYLRRFFASSHSSSDYKYRTVAKGEALFPPVLIGFGGYSDKAEHLCFNPQVSSFYCLFPDPLCKSSNSTSLTNEYWVPGQKKKDLDYHEELKTKQKKKKKKKKNKNKELVGEAEDDGASKKPRLCATNEDRAEAPRRLAVSQLSLERPRVAEKKPCPLWVGHWVAAPFSRFFLVPPSERKENLLLIYIS